VVASGEWRGVEMMGEREGEMGGIMGGGVLKAQTRERM